MPDSIAYGSGLKARSIGPGLMGGRISALAFDPHDPYTYYAGLATGGVVRTTDNGQTFSPVFEKEAVASIGDIALAPSDSNVIWVATGEANDRNSTGWGAGVFRSTDGGATLDLRRPQGQQEHRAHRRQPHRREDRVGRGERQSLGRERRARRLQDHRRRRDLDQGAQRAQALRHEGRRR